MPAPDGQGENMDRRRIPSSGAELPVIGVGTWKTFDVGARPQERAPLAEALEALFTAGGSVIDSSPMYGRAEAVVGDLLAAAHSRDKAFLATKVWTRGEKAGVSQMEQSLQRFRTHHIELMQVHNLLDWRTHVTTLRAWKRDGRIRYLGVTHYTSSAYDELEQVLRSETLDFVQLNYSLEERSAERRLLPLAAARGLAVLVNLPFGGGGLLRRLRSKPLPEWAAEIECRSWAQVLLKYLLGEPAVTCVIAGTSRPEHMRDNANAGSGPFPDQQLRARMADQVL
jgi:diketogulonate reductase-like aldo/keto reductase